VVSCGVKPWFEAFVGARGTGKDGDTKMGKIFSPCFKEKKISISNQVYQ
jgi:hypothetical protein